MTGLSSGRAIAAESNDALVPTPQLVCRWPSKCFPGNTPDTQTVGKGIGRLSTLCVTDIVADGRTQCGAAKSDPHQGSAVAASPLRPDAWSFKLDHATTPTRLHQMVQLWRLNASAPVASAAALGTLPADGIPVFGDAQPLGGGYVEAKLIAQNFDLGHWTSVLVTNSGHPYDNPMDFQMHVPVEVFLPFGKARE